MESSIPSLTLTPDLDETVAGENSTAEIAGPAPEAAPDMSMLSAEEQKAVLSFAEQIDISNSQQVLTYGAAAQKNIADFSESALESVRTKDMGEIGDMITNLVKELRSIEPEEEKRGLAGLFHKANNSIETMRIQYSKAETNVDRIVTSLETHQRTLMKDVAVMDQMYDKNLDYYKQLTMYILAGKSKIARERNETLHQMQEKAQQSGKAEDAQAANDYSNLIDRFEKKLHDLELTRIVSLQMGPQIRMLQNNDTQMIEKIQTSLVNTIPLWKSQMVLTLGIHHSKQAMEAQRQVTDMTNQLLRSNAEMLKMATVETAKEAERSVVDIETLKQTNENLISALDEVMTIQAEGRQKRAEAEQEMRRIEGELKQKLLEIRK
jgi:uncharacterized protein YaaN involved in tellurite resistance